MMNDFDKEEMKEWYATKRMAFITDTFLTVSLIVLGLHYNLFNWNGDWWYSALTILAVISGHISRWKPREES